MQIKLDRINPTKVKLLIEADLEELQQAKKQAILKLGSSVKIAGFRDGKAPVHLIEKSLEPNLLGQETLEIVINSLYSKALIKEQLRPVNNPAINVASFVPYDQLSFEAEVDVVGAVKVGNYKGLSIKQDEVKVSAKEVNQVLDRLLNQLATRTEITRPAKNGDEVLIDFEGFDKKTNQPVTGAAGNDYPLILGSKSFIPGFEDKLLNAKKNDPIEFELTFPPDYGVKFLQNKKVNFKVSVKQVSKIKLPALDDSFAKLVGTFDSIDDLKKDIKKELETTKKNDAEVKQQNEIVEKIVLTSTVDIPSLLMEEEFKRIDKEQRQNAAYSGKTWSEYLSEQGLNEAEFIKQAQEQAVQRIKIGLVLGAIAGIENISSSKAELKTKLEALKKQYANDQQMQQELAKPDNQQDINNRLLVEKTVKRLVELNS